MMSLVGRLRWGNDMRTNDRRQVGKADNVGAVVRVTAMAGAIIVILCARVEASALPRYDVEKYCKEIANVGGAYSASTDAACFSVEQKAYDALKGSWPSVSAAAAIYCNEIATVGGAGSYATLKACIENENRSAGANATRKFRY